MSIKETEPLVFRQVAFPVSAFDYLKEFQRRYEKTHGIRLNNNQALAAILAEHKQTNVESGSQNAGTESEALFRLAMES